MTTPSNNPPAGFYDHEGRQRWWDGSGWTDHYQTAAVAAPAAPVIAAPASAPQVNNVTVNNVPLVYNRQQKGHSLILHLIFGGFLLYIPTIYYAVSPNHYYHA